MRDPRPGETLAHVFDVVVRFADEEQSKLRPFTASICTYPAYQSYVDGMTVAEAAAREVADYLDSGLGDEPGTEMFRSAGTKVGEAVGMLDTSPCER